MDLLVVDSLIAKAVVLSLALTRVAVAFVLLPLFSNELIPATVRNSIFVSVALVVVIVHVPVDVNSADTTRWLGLFVKELLIGVSLGIFFGVFLWAFEAAGTIIDTQIGSSIATIYDPVSGHEVTLFGELLAKWANYLFVTAGGLMFFVGSLMHSYQQFPIHQSVGLRDAAVVLFETEFMRFFTLALMIAAPVMVFLFLVDASMGIVNRFAQQLNVMFLAISVKSLVALVVLIALIPVLGQLLIEQLLENQTELASNMNRIFK